MTSRQLGGDVMKKEKWVLVVYMKAGFKRYVGPFKTRAQAQQYGRRIIDMASYEAEPLVTPLYNPPRGTT